MSATETVENETPESGSTELDALVRTAVERVSKGSMTMEDLLKALQPKDAVEVAPAEAPVAVAITDDQRKAIDRLPEVFGKVVPAERRALQPAEVSALVEEKEVLDEVKKMADARQNSMRTTVFNHLDVLAESEEDFDPEGAPRDHRGHYTLPGEVRGTPETAKRFTREVKQSAPSLDTTALQALVEDPEVDFTHEDYLKMTTQVRVVDEAKVMAALKKNPKLVHAVAKATRPGSKTASMHLRKA